MAKTPKPKTAISKKQAEGFIKRHKVGGGPSPAGMMNQPPGPTPAAMPGGPQGPGMPSMPGGPGMQMGQPMGPRGPMPQQMQGQQMPGGSRIDPEMLEDAQLMGKINSLAKSLGG